MEQEKKVSEETKSMMSKANPYNKDHGENDPETEAFAKGELAKFHREQREKAEAATEQKDTDASEETAEKSDKEAPPIAERPVKLS